MKLGTARPLIRATPVTMRFLSDVMSAYSRQERPRMDNIPRITMKIPPRIGAGMVVNVAPICQSITKIKKENRWTTVGVISDNGAG
jgi:hypothetical protein